MNKKTFNSILLFTGTVLLTIIALQIIWINNITAIRKKELFSNSQQALNNTVLKLQQNENSMALMEHSQQFMSDSIVLKDSANWDQVVIINDKHHSDTTITSTTVMSMDSSQRVNMIVRNVVHNFNSIEDMPDVQEVSKIKMEKMKENLDSLAGQIIVQIESRSLPERLNASQLNHILKEQLRMKGIDIDFEYAVFNGDSMVVHSDHFVQSSFAMTFETKLFPNDIFDRNLKLVMYYPVSESNEYLFSKMKTTLLLTGLFTIGILIAFYLTVRTIKKQKKLSEMKNDFINNITHEFKTPIATSSIAIAALANDQVRIDAEKFRYFTDILKEENSKMNLQVEKVLQMSMMEKGKIEVDLVRINIHDSLHESIKGFELIFKESNMDVSTELTAENFIVKTDPFHIKHVFNNIIDNAVKYKGENGQLNVSTSNRHNHLIITFIDNGIGMNNEVQKNAFEKFYRGQKGNIHEVKGFGLGLSYAKSIVELSKGTISLHSKPGNGTEVIISLPLV